MTHLPFFNRYPYTNYEQINLDWLMNTVGSFQSQIDAHTEILNNHETRITVNENDITDLKNRMDTAEDDIDNLESRMDTAEDDIDNLESRMDAAETDITNIDARVTVNEGDIVTINNTLAGMTVDDMLLPDSEKPVQNKVIYNRFRNVDVTLNQHMQLINQHSSDIVALSGIVSRIPVVQANPGGTGTALNTISIGGVVYEIVGGGGGGSSVTPNPSGAATDELKKVDIDGTIYEIAPATVTPNPVGTAIDELESVEINGDIYDIPKTVVDSSLDPNSNNAIKNAPVATAIDTIESDIDTINDDLTARGTTYKDTKVSNITNTNLGATQDVTLPAGSYFIGVNWKTSGMSNVSSIGMNVSFYDMDNLTSLWETGEKVSAGGFHNISMNSVIHSDSEIHLRLNTYAGSNPNGTYNVTSQINAVRIK